MTDHLQERDIDRLLSEPDGIDQDWKNQMDLHVSGCPQCSELLSFFRDAYESAGEQSTGTDERVEEFVSSLTGQPSVIRLSPYRFSPAAASLGDRTATVLAAKTEAPNRYRFTSVCTYVSGDERTLIRILRDDELHRFTLFLITHDRPEGTNVRVRFPSLGVEILVPGDASHADLILPLGGRNVDWSSITAEILFARD